MDTKLQVSRPEETRVLGRNVGHHKPGANNVVLADVAAGVTRRIDIIES